MLIERGAYVFSPYAIPTAVTTVLMLLFGVAVLMRRVSRVSGAFFSLTFFASVWLFAFTFMYSARDAAHALFARDGKPVSVIRDSGGFVTQRVVAAIVNIGSDICQQRICSPKDLETAVTLGLGYPIGPLAMGNRWGPSNILEVLFNMQTVYGDPRYRPSPWLRRRGAIGLSLLHEE